MKEFTHALVMLGLMIPLIIGILYGLKFVMARPLNFKKDKAIRLIHQLALGSKERLVWVEVDGARLLLGVTPQHISTLYTTTSNSPSIGPTETYIKEST